MDTSRRKRSLRKILLGAGLLLAAAAVALPFARNKEHLPLDAQARKLAPGQFVRLSQGLVHYRTAGPQDGRPVILIHGFSVPDYVFDNTRRDLAQAGFRAISFDLYGRGWSDRPDVRYDRDLFAQEVLELMDALHIEKADVLGLSMGGAVAGRFAARHPERVRTLTLVAPLTHSFVSRPINVPGFGEWIWHSFVLPNMGDTAKQTEDFVHPERFGAFASAFGTQMQYEGFGRSILSTVRNLVGEESVPDFEIVGKGEVPALLVWGDRDATIPPATHADVQRAMPKVQYVSLPGQGHLPMVEAPEAVHPPVIAFLRQH